MEIKTRLIPKGGLKPIEWTEEERWQMSYQLADLLCWLEGYEAGKDYDVMGGKSERNLLKKMRQELIDPKETMPF